MGTLVPLTASKWVSHAPERQHTTRRSQHFNKLKQWLVNRAQGRCPLACMIPDKTKFHWQKLVVLSSWTPKLMNLKMSVCCLWCLWWCCHTCPSKQRGTQTYKEMKLQQLWINIHEWSSEKMSGAERRLILCLLWQRTELEKKMLNKKQETQVCGCHLVLPELPLLLLLFVAPSQCHHRSGIYTATTTDSWLCVHKQLLLLPSTHTSHRLLP